MAKVPSKDRIAFVCIGLVAFAGARLALRTYLEPSRSRQERVVSIDWAVEARVDAPHGKPAARAPAKATLLPRDQALELIASKYSLTPAELRMVRYSEATGHAFVAKSHEQPEAVDRNDFLVRVDEAGVAKLAEYPHDPGSWTEFSAGGEYGIVLNNKPRESSYLFNLSGTGPKLEPFEFVLSYSDYVTEEPRFSPNGEYLAARTVSNGLIYLLETKSGSVRRLNDPNRETDRLLSVAFTPDSQRVVATVGGQPGLVRIIHLRNAALSRDLPLPAGLTHPVFRAFTQGGRTLEIVQGNGQDRKPASTCDSDARIDIESGVVKSCH
jgi:hypothetical protein